MAGHDAAKFRGSLAALLRNGLGPRDRAGPDKLYLLETRLAPMLRHAPPRRSRRAGRQAARRCAAAMEREIIEAMTTNESSFFRDDKPFTHVRTQALPRLHAARPPGTKLRIWSAAGSTGQEAYSLAMILAEQQGADRRPRGGDRRHRHRARAVGAGAGGRLHAVRSAARAAGADAAEGNISSRKKSTSWRLSWTRYRGMASFILNGTCSAICGRSGCSTWCSAATC